MQAAACWYYFFGKGRKMQVIPAPEDVNIFPEDGLDIWLALGLDLPGSMKFATILGMLWAAKTSGILEGIDTLVEATSGNSGVGLLSLAPKKPFEIKNIKLVVQSDLADGKRGPLTLLGAKFVDPEENLTTVETARKLGGGGWHDGKLEANGRVLNLDQYGSPYNPLFYREILALDILDQMPEMKTVSLWCGIGTGGSMIGLSEGLRSRLGSKQVRTVGTLCSPGQKVPGMRDRERMKDITLPWEQATSAVQEVGTRPAYTAGLTMARASVYLFGPSCGAALMGGLQDFKKAKDDGELDRLYPRNASGKRPVVVFCPDGFRPYTDHYHANLTGDMLRRSTTPSLAALLA